MGYLALPNEPDAIFLLRIASMHAIARLKVETYELRSNSYRVVGYYYWQYIRLHMACQSVAKPHSQEGPYLTVGNGCEQKYS